MRLVIVTGMSGAGKTNALKMLEDMGFYCVDNLPIPLVEKFAELTLSNQGGIRNAALGIDIRSGDELSALDRIFDEWSRKRVPYEILFLDASSETLIKRYKESRRAHPLAGEGRIDSGIEKERLKLAFLKEEADYIIDTSKLLTKELKAELEKIFMANESYKNLYITILSFGFKYGIPSDADLVFDVRFLPNPYYIEELREQTGDDAPVYDYVMSFDQTKEFIRHLKSFLDYVFIQYKNEKKNHLTVGIGCTGGHHRSVSVTNWLYSHYRDHYHCYKSHRDKKVG